MAMELFSAMNGALCACGRAHTFDAQVLCGAGVLRRLPQLVRALHATKVFVLSDENTFEAAGRQTVRLLEEAGIGLQSYILPERAPHPDEARVGAAVMHMQHDCDMVISVGGGVLNDIGKMLAATARVPYGIVATAPSMDGFASATSSMTRDGLKVSLPTKCADVILGDTDILCRAPKELLLAGLGDMLAKYVSICEWRIAHLITGEYYCEAVAQLVRLALRQCVAQADGLLRREPQAVAAVFEGLVIGGAAMNYAGCSRPASGNEHYISHVLDMRSVEFGEPCALHGIQCAIGTLEILRLYEKLPAFMPDREKALAHAAAFDYAAHAQQLRAFLGCGAESMIALERKEKKYDLRSHTRRFARIEANWERIIQIVREELPPAHEIEALLARLGAPKCLSDIGVEETVFPTAFRVSGDIRDKYVLSRLAWDLGITRELLSE